MLTAYEDFQFAEMCLSVDLELQNNKSVRGHVALALH